MSSVAALPSVNSIRAGLETRISIAAKELSDAIDARRWSHLAGQHGIRTALSAAVSHLLSERTQLTSVAQYRALAERFATYARECDDQREDALQNERFDQVSAFDGMSTGWLIARKVILDELGR